MTPRISAAIRVNRWLSRARLAAQRLQDEPVLVLVLLVGRGTAPAASNSTPLWTSRVASPPSSTIMFGPCPSPKSNSCVGAPPVLLQGLALPGEHRGAAGLLDGAVGPTTTAAAASSWVEKMLQDTQRTWAPSATRVSMSTAVWTVMCSEPATRAPASGWACGELAPDRHQAGHLVFGQAHLVPAGLGQRQVRHRELDTVDVLQSCVHGFLFRTPYCLEVGRTGRTGTAPRRMSSAARQKMPRRAPPLGGALVSGPQTERGGMDSVAAPLGPTAPRGACGKYNPPGAVVLPVDGAVSGPTGRT